jgi:hypothetical protein
MARNSLGQYTRRRRSTQAERNRFLGKPQIEGIEENGVTSGETVVLGEAQTSGGGGPVTREGKAKA